MRKRGRSVLDSFAVLAFLFKEQGHEEVLALFEWAVDHGERHIISSVNWAEVDIIWLRE
jgi:PIN domain nuclease of toxin-antitoxin system